MRTIWFRKIHKCARATAVAIVILGQVSSAWASSTVPQPAPTVEEAAVFLDEAEERLLQLIIDLSRAEWLQQTYIIDDSEILAAQANGRYIAATVELAKEATRFADLELPYDVARKLLQLRLALTMPAPSNDEEREELTQIAASMASTYGKGEYCTEGADSEESCRDLGELSQLLRESDDPKELLDAWVGWRTISPPMREAYQRFVELGNKGARELGFADLGAMWRSKYDMDPEEFTAELDRLWGQVKPLYDSLHCFVRGKLSERYGADVVPENGPIPAHLLGNMWAQSWGNVYRVAAPPNVDPGFDLTAVLEERGVDELEMVRYGEGFFTSLGFEPLPETFWQRSLFKQPADRDVVCHASAWDIDMVDDLRIKMCIEINDEDFSTIHHELGHNFYQRAYSGRSLLYRDSANDGFHEGIGDTVALSVTPEYLVKLGLLDEVPPASKDLGGLMKMALDKVAFLPFGLLIDQWRWKVFSGEVAPNEYNAAWWELRERYQGVAAPVERSEADFDPGAKYHIPNNTPYTRYFLAHILQFQFHRALCDAAGFEGPLHRCSIYGDRQAGERLIKMLEMGSSRPWPEALEAISGQQEMDATAILDYFAPLQEWLNEENQGRRCGW